MVLPGRRGAPRLLLAHRVPGERDLALPHLAQVDRGRVQLPEVRHLREPPHRAAVVEEAEQRCRLLRMARQGAMHTAS
jgi:hypothetical protein